MESDKGGRMQMGRRNQNESRITLFRFKLERKNGGYNRIEYLVLDGMVLRCIQFETGEDIRI